MSLGILDHGWVHCFGVSFSCPLQRLDLLAESGAIFSDGHSDRIGPEGAGSGNVQTTIDFGLRIASNASRHVHLFNDR